MDAKLDRDLKKATKKSIIDADLLADKESNIESKGEDLDKEDEDDLDYSNANSYSHAIIITYRN